jgi:hypothetical protein
MRLLSMFFVVAIAMFGLAGVAVAQERTRGQDFEVREMTGPEGASRTPTSERSAEDAQENAGCPGAVELGSIPPAGEPPTDERLEIGPFPVTGESFRLTYETSDADQSGLPLFDVTVLDAAGKEVGGQVISDEGVVTETVRAGPGRFTIMAVSDDLKYRITVEDCTGGGQPAPTNSGDQYDNGTDNPDDVIDDTISDQPLPNTGGVPLLGLAVVGCIFIFGALAVLRPVIRRDS